MGTTSRYTWRYPELSDSPNVPRDVRALAEDVENTVGAIDDRVTKLAGNITRFQHGQTNVPLVNNRRAETTVNFPVSFASAGFTPIVLVTLIESGFQSHLLINNISSTGFKIRIDATGSQDFPSDRTISWVAIGE